MRQSGHISAAYAVVQGQGFVCDMVAQSNGVCDPVFSV